MDYNDSFDCYFHTVITFRNRQENKKEIKQHLYKMERRKKKQKTKFGNEFSFQLIDLLMDDKIRNKKHVQSISNFFFCFFFFLLSYLNVCVVLSHIAYIVVPYLTPPGVLFFTMWNTAVRRESCWWLEGGKKSHTHHQVL